MIELTELQQYVGYFAQKITGCEAEALTRAILIVKELNQLGITVFSPGIHSIPQFLLGIRKNWLKEDFFFLEHWGDKIIMFFDQTCFTKDFLKKIEGNLFWKVHVSEFENRSNWNSEGAYREHCWAKSKEIKCLLVEPLLQKHSIQEI